MLETEAVEELFFNLLLTGHVVKEETLIKMLSLLYDMTFNEEYDNVELNGNTLFVEKCLPFFISARKELNDDEEIVSIDLFIDEYRRLLIKDEQYELLEILDL